MAKTTEELLAQYKAGGPLTTDQITGKVTPQTYDTTYPTVPTTIDSSMMNPNPPMPFVTPQKTATPTTTDVNANYDVPNLPNVTATPEQKSLSQMIQDLTQTNSSLVGKSAYTAEQQNIAGLPQALETQKSLSKQILALQAAEKNIPLQQQQDVLNRGITTAGGLAPLQAAELRKNAIQANILGAQLAAAQLDVASAQTAVEKAVNLKYGPLEEAQKAKLANLELLSKDPNLTIAEKNQVIAQTNAQNKITQALATKKENETRVYEIANDAAKNGADAQTLALISKSTDPYSALKIASEKGFAVPKSALPASAQEYNFAVKNGYTGTYTDYQNEDANRKKSIAAAGVAGDNGLTPKETQNFLSITTKFQADPFITNTLKGETAVAIADQILKNPDSATNQLKSLYVLVKNLDPDSAVREGEITLAERTQSYLQTWQATLTRITEGQVIAPDTAKNLATATKELATAWNATAKKRQAQYKAQAIGVGGRVGRAFDEYIQTSKAIETNDKENNPLNLDIKNDPLGIN